MADLDYVDFLYREQYLQILRAVKTERWLFLKTGGSRNQARRRFGGAIHLCETVLAAYNQQITQWALSRQRASAYSIDALFYLAISC